MCMKKVYTVLNTGLFSNSGSIRGRRPISLLTLSKFKWIKWIILGENKNLWIRLNLLKLEPKFVDDVFITTSSPVSIQQKNLLPKCFFTIQKCSTKKTLFKNFAKLTRKTPVLESLFNKNRRVSESQIL